LIYLILFLDITVTPEELQDYQIKNCTTICVTSRLIQISLSK
jgi:hypothetical protein